MSSRSRRRKKVQRENSKRKTENINSFLAVTGKKSNKSEAKRYLEMSDWQLEKALQSYFAAGDETDSNSKGKRPLTSDEGETVRAPIPSKKLRLAESDDVHFIGSQSSTVMEPFRQYRRETVDGSQTNDLASLFAPPHAIMFRGNFQQLMRVAQQQSRWILVNIQSTTEFDSHRLNRDTWSDETVQDIVKESFLFWQQDRATGVARNYLNFYRVTTFPHVGMIDPRTGELVFKKSGFIDPPTLTCMITELMEKYDLSELSGEGETTKASPISNHDTPLRKAIQASLLDPVLKDVKSKSSDKNVDVEIEKTQKAICEENEDVVKSVVENVPVEPKEDDPEATSLQFRLPNGERITRRFLKTDLVLSLYDFVKATRSETTKRAFDLRLSFPPKSLQRITDMTLSDASLLNSLVLVRWVDQ